MKKIIASFLILAVVALSCKEEKTSEFTRLADGTPYSNSPEMMIGKVKSVIEKNYWAIPDGESFKKGNALTQADRDSLGGWTDDFEAIYDASGIIQSCTALDETGAQLWKYESVVENGLIAKSNIYVKDTLSSYDVYEYDENKFLSGGKRYRANVDTLMFSVSMKTNSKGYYTEAMRFNFKGDSLRKNIYTYDAQNNFVSFGQFDKAGVRVFSYSVKYNDKNKVSELEIKDKDDKVLDANYITYDYDAEGNWVRAVVKNLKNKVVIEERTYTYFE